MGLINEHFVIGLGHQRGWHHSRHRCSQWRDSRVCDGAGRAESNTNTYGDLNAYTYTDTYRDANRYSYSHDNAYSYVHTKAYASAESCSYT